MRNLLFALVCLLAFPAIALSSTEERVVRLPQDQGRWYVSIFGEPTDAQFQRVQAWFETDKALANLRAQVHFNVYATSSPRFARYAENLPGLACVRVQNSRGLVISEWWASYIPASAQDLFRGIKSDIHGRLKTQCPWLRPEPQPAPVPSPAPIPVVDTPPEIVAEPEPEPGFPILLTVLAAVVGLGLGVGQGFKKEHLDQPPRVLKKI